MRPSRTRTSGWLAGPGPSASRKGFTLVEVLMALLVLQVAVVGVLATMALASRTLRRAEQLERATGRVEALLDSLRPGATADSATHAFDDVVVSWAVDTLGRVDVAARDRRGGLLMTAWTRVPPR